MAIDQRLIGGIVFRSLNKTNTIIGLLCLYFLCWILIPTVATSSYPLDVIEGIVWGQEWQWGYYKHPPLPSWLLYAFYATFGYMGPYLLSQLSLMIALGFVYALAKQLVSADKAFFAAIFLLASFYYTWPSLEYNHNIAQLPLWAAIGYFYYQAIQNNQYKYWLTFGVLCGLGLLTKYTTLLLLLCLLLYSFSRPYRYVWRTPAVWLAILFAVLVFLPHVYWLYVHDWLPFNYALGRANTGNFWQGRITSITFLVAQVINHLPLLLIVLFTAVVSKIRRFAINPKTHFILFIALAPATLTVTIGLLFNIKLHDMWGMPMWNYSGLLLVLLLPDKTWHTNKQRLVKGLLVWLTLVTVLMGLYVNVGATWRNKNARIDWPQKALAKNALQQWHHLSRCPLTTVTGEYWLAGLAIVGQPTHTKHPSLLIAGSPQLSPWVKSAEIEQFGSLFIWQNDATSSPYLTNLSTQQFVISEGQWQLQWPKQPRIQPLTIHWRAYVPQRCLP